MEGVEGRVVLVTGAGSPEGIGFATARLLKASGAKSRYNVRISIGNRDQIAFRMSF